MAILGYHTVGCDHPGLSRYVSSTGKLRARVRIRIAPAAFQSMTWGFRFEQATFICRKD